MGRKYLAQGLPAMEPGRWRRRSALMPRSFLLMALARVWVAPVPARAQDDSVLASRAAYQQAVMADSDLASLRSLKAFDVIRQSLARNAEPVMRSQPAFTLPERDLLTEGLAYDARTGAFLVGSVHHRKILRVDRSG